MKHLFPKVTVDLKKMTAMAIFLGSAYLSRIKMSIAGEVCALYLGLKSCFPASVYDQ